MTESSRMTLAERLRERARIRRQIPTRKSAQEGKPDRLADLLDEAADALSQPQAVAEVVHFYSGRKSVQFIECERDLPLGTKLYLASPPSREGFVSVPKGLLDALHKIHTDCEGVSYSYHWRDADAIWKQLAAAPTEESK